MLRRVYLIVLLGLVMGLVLSFGTSAGAQPTEEDGTVNEGGSGGELDRLDQLRRQAEAADGEYRNALHEEGQLNDQIAATRKDLTETEQRLAETESEMRGQAKEVYKHGNFGMLDALMQAKDFREFVQLSGFMLRQLGRDQAEVQKLRQQKAELEQTQQALENQMQKREGVLGEKTDKSNEAEQALTYAQKILDTLGPEQRANLEQQKVQRTQETVDQILQAAPVRDGSAKRSARESQDAQPQDEEIAGDEQEGQTSRAAPAQEGPKAEEEKAQFVLTPGTAGERGSADEFTPEEEQDRQAKVSQALAETIREFAARKGAPDKEQGNKERSDEAASQNEGTPQDLVAQNAADAAQKQEEAQSQARDTAERVSSEKEAEKKAAEESDAARTAKLAAEQAAPEERAKAQDAAQEAQRRADLAAEEAAAKKADAEKAAEEAVTQKQSSDEAAARLAAEKAAARPADLPLAPSDGTAGTPSGSESAVLNEADSWLGVPYDYAHKVGPAGMTRAGVDCSAFTAAVYQKFGVVLPDSPVAQWDMGVPVSGPPKAGDLVFWSEDGSGIPTHVGIADGNGNAVHASIYFGDVTTTPISAIPGYLGARRLL